ncbi:MAG: HIT domain-containing protein [Syntrophorhabdus sp.]|jgi:ATP adenylyltransferase|nr:HIT domain-containing protein [Syntrophorhabdus sp.]
MDRVWAPWRMEYITGTKAPGEKRCFLCIDEGKDNESLVIGRLGKAFVIMNRFPYTNGHVMVVPVRHTGLMEDLTDEESLDIMRLVKIMVRVYKEEFSVEGINIGINVGRAAGAGLEEHIHVHMVPRWFGDTNFMAVTGETRVISEHLMTSYERLKRRFLETVL